MAYATGMTASPGIQNLTPAQYYALKQAGYTGAALDGQGLTFEPGMTVDPNTKFINPGSPGVNVYGGGVPGGIVGKTPQTDTNFTSFFGPQAATTPATPATPAPTTASIPVSSSPSTYYPSSSNPNASITVSNGYYIGNRFIQPQDLQYLKNLMQEYQGGDVNAGRQFEIMASQVGMNEQQLGQAIQTASPLAQVKGVDGTTLFRDQNGQYFSMQGGQRVAATQDQLSAGQFPTLAGYDSQGNPYYQAAKPQTAAQQQLQKAQENAVTPEAAAYASVAATDPAAAAITANLESYYQNQSRLANKVATPTGLTDIEQQYLAAADKLDPRSAAIRNTIGQSYYNDLSAANRGILPAGVSNEVAQSARAAQIARGNALGTSQAAQEALSTGLTGLQIKQQAQQNAQSWLGSGLTPAQQAASFYTFGQGAGSSAAGNANSWLGSGNTRGQQGSKSLADIINQSTSANNQTPYQPTNIGSPYTYLNPQSGGQFAQGAQGYYNALSNTALGAASLGMNQGSPAAGAATGALSGAASGAMAGSVIPGIGTAVGAIGGALIGGAGGYLSGRCWVAREVYGPDNPKWLEFRKYLDESADPDLRKFYLDHGSDIAKIIRNNPDVKELIRHLMNAILNK